MTPMVPMLRASLAGLLFAAATGAAQGQTAQPQPGTLNPAALPGGVTTSDPTGEPTAPSPAPPAFSPAPTNAAPQKISEPVRISGGVMAAMVVTKVDPVYPAEAKAAGLSGSVVLLALISKTGSVETLQVMSGPAVLASAAKDAVKQWTYKPYLLQGQPVKVLTTVTVTFQPPAAPQ